MLISEMLARAVQIRGRETAVTTHERSYSWSEIAERAGRLAGGLQAIGLNEGDRVAVLSRNGIAFFDAYLALPWAGLVMTCLNIRWSAREIIEAVNDSEARALLIDEEFAGLVEDLLARCPTLPFVISTGDGSTELRWETLATEGDPAAPCASDMHDLAYIFYTGGTTGQSKGVMLSHLNVCTASLARLSISEFTDRSVACISVPLFHVGGAVFVWMTLAAGGHLRLMPSFEPGADMRAIEQVGATHVGWVPTMLSAVLDHPEVDRIDLSSLRRISYGAAPMPPSLLARVLSRMPLAKFIQYYGMTESAACGTWLGPLDHEQPDGTLRTSVGRAWPGLELTIVGPDDVPLAEGEIGEICLRGPMVMSGYWKQPELTAEALRGGWLHTGDLARLTDGGYVYLADRLKDMIITGGENVYSTEVENVLLSHPSVQECAVIGLPDEHWGEVVCAVVHSDREERPDLKTLQEYCRPSLAGFKIPRRLILHGEPLPKSGVGKILKTELRKAYATPIAADGSSPPS